MSKNFTTYSEEAFLSTRNQLANMGFFFLARLLLISEEKVAVQFLVVEELIPLSGLHVVKRREVI
ncbi:hypothetical protein DET50_11843 [Marinobacter pelagius]|uniref:Uncharacterized protein n=1 Tax=Marinobacter pelagius TaxID=379482 RepID=A0A366GHR9_9GAMM|nr:hypothetical protein DET50_11843 [Marinobacter pelagius]